ncbi:MAG: SIS domain-containing protein [Anaerolineae bacterium]|nr:SIS domain-containing protein [Anaerolineae bacterium]
MPHTVTETEIASQVDAWKDALQSVIAQEAAITRFWNDGGFDYIICTGCGSTHYLAQTAAQCIQEETGISARGVPASELLFHPSVYLPGKRPLLVTISRSGSTTETVQAAKAFRERFGSGVIVISCYADKPLNELADLSLVAEAGQEISVAQTRSFSAMLLMAQGLARIAAGKPLQSDLLDSMSAQFVEFARTFATPYADPAKFQQYFYLGSGPRYGLAAEAMLKMKEMSLTYAEAYHPMEFRHGPMSMVDEQTVVVGLLGQEAYAAERAVLNDMAALGATTLCLADQPGADFSLADYPSLLVCYLPLLQWMAYLRAENKGLNPDQPRNLGQVVYLQADSLNNPE